MVKLTSQGQHHVVFGTHWELNSGRGIRIPLRVPLHHGPKYVLNPLNIEQLLGYQEKNLNFHKILGYL